MSTAKVITAEEWRKGERGKGKARARASHTRGKMNKTEAEYADLLKIGVAGGAIAEFWFERVTLILGHDCRYTPDFLVQLADGTLEFHEVKGPRKEEDAMVKLRVAASEFPHVFRLAESNKDETWRITEVKSR